jgi:hypothetical protein
MKRSLTCDCQNTKRLLYFALSLVLIFLYACGSETKTTSETGTIAFRVTFEGAPTEEVVRHAAQLDCADAGVDEVEGKVYDENDEYLASDAWPCEDHQGTIGGVPAGSNRKVVVLGKDSSGDILYRGEVTDITVVAGKTTEPIDITLEPTFYTDQDWYTSADYPSDYISGKWEEGYYITSLTYGNGMWAVVMSEGVGYTNQGWATRTDFPSDYISEKWNEGYQITSLVYGDKWAVVMSEGNDYMESWHTRAEFPSDVISEKWAEGYYITSLAYGNGTWAVVMSEGTGYTNQAWQTNSDFPSDYISEKWNEGYRITSLVYGDKWAVVMSEGTNYTDDWWATRTDFPSDFIDEKWAEGYYITSLAYGNGTWAVVMSQ